jgi:hypothetical protein
MTAITGNFNSPRFDIVEFIQRLKKVNFTQEQAELLAQETERVIDAAISNSKELKTEIKQEIHSDELVTKADLKQQLEITKLELQKEIANSRTQIIIWIGGLIIASGLLQHFFK